jgi:hypothetical protein
LISASGLHRLPAAFDGGHFFFFSLALSFSSSIKESSILFNLSSSSNTGWKYSWRLLNKGGVGGSDGGGLNLRPDKKLLKRWWI